MAGVGNEIDAHALGQPSLGDVIENDQHPAVTGIDAAHPPGAVADIAAAQPGNFTLDRLAGLARFRHRIEHDRVAQRQAQVTAGNPIAKKPPRVGIGGNGDIPHDNQRRIGQYAEADPVNRRRQRCGGHFGYHHWQRHFGRGKPAPDDNANNQRRNANQHQQRQRHRHAATIRRSAGSSAS